MSLSQSAMVGKQMAINTPLSQAFLLHTNWFQCCASRNQHKGKWDKALLFTQQRSERGLTKASGCHVEHGQQQVSVLPKPDLAERQHISISPSVVPEWCPERVGGDGCPCKRALCSFLCRPVEQQGWPQAGTKPHARLTDTDPPPLHRYTALNKATAVNRGWRKWKLLLCGVLTSSSGSRRHAAIDSIHRKGRFLYFLCPYLHVIQLH